MAVERLRQATGAIRAAARIPMAAEAIRMAVEAYVRAELKPAWAALVSGVYRDGLPVPALSVCGHGTAEIRFTKLLRYYLDPTQPHGLGVRGLRALFGQDLALPNTVVEAEVDLGDGCIVDLVIRAPERAILIEQKVYATEARNEGQDGVVTQLARYSAAFAGRWPALADRCDKVFLTPTGRQAADDSSWKALSHESVVERLMELLDDDALTSRAAHNLLTFLWDLLLGPMGVGDMLPTFASKAAAVLDAPLDLLNLHRQARAEVPSMDLVLRLARASYV